MNKTLTALALTLLLASCVDGPRVTGLENCGLAVYVDGLDTQPIVVDRGDDPDSCG